MSGNFFHLERSCFKIQRPSERVVFTPRVRASRVHSTLDLGRNPHAGSFSAPSSLIGGAGYTRSECIKPSHFPISDYAPGSLWDVIRSQQRQISDLQRKVLELSSAMGDLQVTVADRVCTPSVCDSEEYRPSIVTQSATNYKSMRNDYLRFAGSFLSEWQSLRKSRILALPGPSSCVQEISDEESSCATTPRAADEHASRVHRLIQKYTT